MPFPHIYDLTSILPHIRHLEHIKLTDKGHYKVLDYTYSNGPSSFPTPLSLECRGLKFSPSGFLIARPFHKFFNVGEDGINPDFSKEHEVLVKLDGSMIHPADVGGYGIRFMTRAGITDVSLQAELLFPDILRRCSNLPLNITPIFEYVGPENRIVVRYDRSELVLLAARYNDTGQYFSRPELEALRHELGGTLVAPYTGPLGQVADLKGVEGVVIVFSDGFRTKLKAHDYVLRHRAKDNLNRERHVLSLVLSGGVDDLTPILHYDDAAALSDYQGDIQLFIHDLIKDYNALLLTKNNLTKKEIALFIKTQPKWDQPLLFMALSAPLTYPLVAAYFKRHCTRTNRLKEFLSGNPTFPRWHDYYTPEHLN